MSLSISTTFFSEADLKAAAKGVLSSRAEAIAAAARVATGADVEVSISDDGVVIGSRSAEVLRREVGTAGEPPDPVLAAVAAMHSASTVEAVADALAAVLRRA